MPKTPGSRKRHGRNRAIVTLTDAVTKKRRDYLLGEPDSPESRELYRRVIAEREANGRSVSDAVGAVCASVSCAGLRAASGSGGPVKALARASSGSPQVPVDRSLLSRLRLTL